MVGIRVARGSPQVNHLLFADDTMFFCKTNPTCCGALSNILKKYELASGQSINLAKSAITFSSKTPQDIKRRVKLTLLIDNEGGIGKYLGLPEHLSRRKRNIFSSIVDRIRQRSHSWSSKFLSSAGKQFLLKVVLSAMPSDAMTCFKLSASLCKQIQSVLTRFWWDTKQDEKKMAWVSWDKLTLPKNAGGLVFREIEEFNDALLAKLSWRILKEPNSFLSRVLLGKNCNSSSFLTPSSASHGWRGLLAGKELLRKGLGWSAGQGDNINVWSDAWLSPLIPFLPIGPPTLDNKALLVSDLICHDLKMWDITAIRKHLPQYEDQIRKITINVLPLKDYMVWLPVKSGQYHQDKLCASQAKLTSGLTLGL